MSMGQIGIGWFVTDHTSLWFSKKVSKFSPSPPRSETAQESSFLSPGHLCTTPWSFQQGWALQTHPLGRWDADCRGADGRHMKAHRWRYSKISQALEMPPCTATNELMFRDSAIFGASNMGPLVYFGMAFVAAGIILFCCKQLDVRRPIKDGKFRLSGRCLKFWQTWDINDIGWWLLDEW